MAIDKTANAYAISTWRLDAHTTARAPTAIRKTTSSS